MAGRSAIGSDVDPLAVFISKAKTRRFAPRALRASAEALLDELSDFARPDSEYERRQFEDLAQATADRIVRYEGLPVPQIPNMAHWFRQYVIVDLGRMLRTILELSVPSHHREFFLLCFASIIRSASNADPVPVSGLEVTAHMKRRDAAGRIVNPFALFRTAVIRGLDAMEQFAAAASAHASVKVLRADATHLASRVRRIVDAVITSPPYNVAVDYYRRHQLEMYWLGLTTTHEERLKLLPQYVGRPKVPQKHPFVASGEITTPLVKRWDSAIRLVSPARANDFKHYAVAMGRVFREMTRVLAPNGTAVFVVGSSSWNGKVIPTGDLLVELAGEDLTLSDHLWYPVRNRYMSYSRHNGANIDREYVLVFKKSVAAERQPSRELPRSA